MVWESIPWQTLGFPKTELHISKIGRTALAGQANIAVLTISLGFWGALDRV